MRRAVFSDEKHLHGDLSHDHNTFHASLMALRSVGGETTPASICLLVEVSLEKALNPALLPTGLACAWQQPPIDM